MRRADGKTPWALRTFTPAQKDRAVQSLSPLPKQWRPRPGTLVDNEGVRTGQVTTIRRLAPQTGTEATQ